MFKRISKLFLAGALLAAAAGCSAGENDSEKVKVVATYSIIYDLVKNVGGDKVEVQF